MKCANCGISCFKKPLTRVNPVGENGIFWCEECLKTHEPELYHNIIEDETKVEKYLKEIFYRK